MAQSRIHITSGNISEWLASTGFLFLRNELEMARFDKLYPDEIEDVSDFEVDCDRILNGTLKTKVVPLQSEVKQEDIVPLKMVARKGGELPKHILDKLKKNQDERTKNNLGDSEKGTE